MSNTSRRASRGNPPPPANRPQLRLHRPDDSHSTGHPPPAATPLAATPPTAAWSLSRFWAEYLRPLKAINAESRNLAEYEQTLDLWVTLTGDPPLARIDEPLVAEWVAHLARRPGRKGERLSSATLHKHVRTLRSLLAAAGPRRPGRIGARVLTEVPYVPAPKLSYHSTEHDCLTLGEIAALLAKCDRAPRPSLRPGDWWRSLLLTAYYTGLRCGTLLELRWEWLITDELGDWLRIPAEAMKGKRRGHWAAVPPVLRSQLDALRKLTGRGAMLFPWPHGESYFHQTRRVLWSLAELPAERSGYNALHGIRKRAATELAKIDGLITPLFLGHAAQGVTLTHYVQRAALAAAVAKLPPLSVTL